MSGREAMPSGSTGRDELTVRNARQEDEAAIETMFMECFGTPRSRVQWRWRWFGATGSHGDALVLESEGLPVGHWAGSASDMWLAGQRRRMLLGGEVMVLPSFRRRGGMGMLIKAAREIAVAHADVWIGFATEEATRVTGANGGGRIIGRLPMWIVWTKRVPHLPARVGSLAARLLTSWRAIVFAVLPSDRVEVLMDASSEVDELAASSASYSVCIRVRDSAYLRWRWLERPEGQVTALGARTGSGRLSGYAVIGIETTGERRVGRVLDLLASDGPSLRGLLHRSLANLIADDCDIITLDYLDPRSWSRFSLRLLGFANRPGKIVTALCTSDDIGGSPGQLDSWYLTRGDTDVS